MIALEKEFVPKNDLVIAPKYPTFLCIRKNLLLLFPDQAKNACDKWYKKETWSQTNHFSTPHVIVVFLTN